jgi:hypothetical protein
LACKLAGRSWKQEGGRGVACYLYLWHPVVLCSVREVVGVVVILPGHKLQVLCFDIRDDVYKFDNIGRGGRRRNGQPKKRSAKRRSAKARVAGTGFFSFRQQKRLAAASLLGILWAKKISSSLLLEYQVQRVSLPNFFGYFGEEVACFVGALLWWRGLGVDSFFS